jgi:hypothetical protein
MRKHFPQATICTLIIILFTIFIGSCRKEDRSVSKPELSKPDTEAITKFFKSTDSINPAVSKVIDFLKSRSNIAEFVNVVSKTTGLPSWEKSLVINSSTSIAARTANSGTDTVYVFVPVVPENTKEVDGAFACKLVGDSVSFKFYREKDYKKYGFDDSKEVSANKLVSLMMFLQQTAYNTKSFVLSDGRLFNENSNTADSTVKRTLRFNISSSGSSASLSGRIAADQFMTLYYCYQFWALPCGDPLVCGYLPELQTRCQSYTIWLRGTGGSGGPGEVELPQGESGAGSGGGNGSGGGSASTQSMLQGMLSLSNEELSFLNTNWKLSEETYNYLSVADGDKPYNDKTALAKSHIQYLLESQVYLNYCLQRNDYFFNLNGWTIPWFHEANIGYDYPELRANILSLKLDAKQAYYLLNNLTINQQIGHFLSISSNQTTVNRILLLSPVGGVNF